MAATVLLTLAATGCLSKSELPPPRYFRPGPVLPGGAPADAAPAPAGEPAPLRLRDVTAAGHLGERMVWVSRVGGAQEYGFYDEARWTEPPAAFVAAALARALFERGGLVRSSGGEAPVLDVHLRAFEEVVDPQHQAQVALHVLLAGPDGRALLERTFVGAQAVAEHDPAAVALAMGQALDQAVAEAARAVDAAVQ